MGFSFRAREAQRADDPVSALTDLVEARDREIAEARTILEAEGGTLSAAAEEVMGQLHILRNAAERLGFSSRESFTAWAESLPTMTEDERIADYLAWCEWVRLHSGVPPAGRPKPLSI